MSAEYVAVVDKVEVFTHATMARRQADMTCKKGCDSCCHAWLTVSPVEAAQLRAGLAQQTPEVRAEVGARGRRELAREAAQEAGPRCALLGEDGACAAYAQRPLVCRTQGHALRYPTGLVPASAVRMRSKAGDVTHCPLNFVEEAPRPEDVLDAERIDQLLAVVNQRYSVAQGVDSQQRYPLSRLAAEVAL